MKIYKKLLILLATVMFVAATLLLAACSGNVTLTFETNGGASVDPITVKKGEKVTLPELDPKTEDGQIYAFDGWSVQEDLGGEIFRGEITAPKKNTTYYARWTKTSTLSIIYNANAPQDIYAAGTMEEATFSSADAAVAGECAFTVEGYRFVGWADSEGATVAKYQVGDKVDFGNKTRVALYAVWENGIGDALGGKDYLYLNDDGTIELQRQGLGQKTGTYNSQTGIFTFKYETESEGTLSGKIMGEGDDRYFFYFRKDLIGTFNQKGGSAKIVIGDHYAATYTDSNGNSKEGTVEFNTTWNDYRFTGNDDERVEFVFEKDGNTTYIVLQDMDQAGTYYPDANKGYPRIQLNGLGSFTYYFDPENPEYVDQVTQEAYTQAEGTYTVERTVNKEIYFSCEMYVDGNLLETFLFKITDTTNKYFERSDFYGQLSEELYCDGFGNGTYTDENNQKHEGTYTIIHKWWMTLDTYSTLQTWFVKFQYDGATEDIYFALTQSSSGTVTPQLFGKVAKNEVGGLYLFDGAITIGGESYDDAFIMFLLNKNNEAALNDASMILVKLDETEFHGSNVSIYAPVFSGSVTLLSDVSPTTYHFADSHEEDSQINFRLETVGGVTKAKFITATGGDIEKRTIADGVVVDPNTSTATYTDEKGVKHENLRYTYSTGEFVEMYVIKLDDTHYLYYYRDLYYDKNTETFTKISAKQLFEYSYYTDKLYYPYQTRLFLIPNSNRAFIATPMGLGDPVYVGDGTYTATSTGEYTFSIAHWLEDDKLLEFFGGSGFRSSLDQFHADYESFTFRTEVGTDDAPGKYYVRFDDMYFALENFVADGYDIKATYTTDNSRAIEGTFYRMEIIIVFTPDDHTDVDYYLKEEDTRMINVSTDAGLYYLYQPDDITFSTFGPASGSRYFDYIVYDGGNKVTIITYADGILQNSPIEGTMEKTANWSESLREYRITETATGNTYLVLLGSFENIWRDEFLVYDVYNEAYNGDWWVEEDGELVGNIHGDGYRLHEATYDADGDGIVDYYGTFARAAFDKKDIQTHAYTVDENGDTIVFTYETSDLISTSFVFDINKVGETEYLTERKMIFGAFAYWTEGERQGDYIYLDGKGNAQRYSADGNLIGEGTYRYAPEISETSYCYEQGATKFYFAIYIEQTDTGASYFEYRMYTERVEGEYDSDDWGHLSVNGYGEVTYTDCYGMVYQGYYSVDGTTLTLTTYDGTNLTFDFLFAYGSGMFGLKQ